MVYYKTIDILSRHKKEIYKTSSSLKDFCNTVQKLLEDNDYKLKYNKLLEKYNEIEKRNFELQIQRTI